METTQNSARNTKEIFKQCQTCSRTFGHILNREFGYPLEDEERALNPLAGGIMNEGHQCGMLWGSALAVGAEAGRQHKDIEEAMAVTTMATQHITESFTNRTAKINCKEIIGLNLKSVLGMTKFMLKIMIQGMDNSHCFNLAEDWAPEAIQAAIEGMEDHHIELQRPVMNCAAMVAQNMGATKKEMVMVSGFAGGLGLSGNACGALSAAIWMKMLQWCRENPEKSPPFYNNKDAKKILKAFNKETSKVALCSEITGQEFESVNEHSSYLRKGGCAKLIEVLAQV